MRRTIILATLMLFAFVGVNAQSLEKVLEKHFAATGVEKMADVKTIIMNAKMSMMGMDMPMSIQVKNPRKFRVEMEMMGQKTISAYDGKQGWMINPMMGEGVKDLDGPQLDKAMEQANMMEGELYNYKQKGSTAELLGKDNNDFKVKLTGKDGTAKTYYIDGDTYLVKKMTAKIEAMGQTIDIESKMTDYMNINGINMAKRIDVETPMGTQTVFIEEVKFDEKIDDSVFTRPAN